MKNVILSVIIAVSFILGSCNSQVEKVEDAVNLTAQVLEMDGGILGNRIVAIHNDEILLAVSGHSSSREVCLLRNDSVIKLGSTIKLGTGPYEFSHPTCFVSYDTKCTYIYSMLYEKMFYVPFPLENLLDTEKWVPFIVNTPQRTFWGHGYKVAQAINDSTIISVGGSVAEGDEYSNVLSYIKDKGEVLPIIGLPYPDEVKAPNIAKRQVYNGAELFKRPSHNKYVLVGDRNYFVALFELEDNQVKNLVYVHDKFPNYYVDKDGKNPKYDRNDPAGPRICCNTNHFYLLDFPFKSMEEYLSVSRKGSQENYPANYCRTIQVYDWEGKHIKTFNLNIPITSFVVDENDEHIYGNSIDLETGEEILVRYQIKP